jgi:hypothetical protein
LNYHSCLLSKIIISDMADDFIYFIFVVLTPFSAIFQLYHGDQF